MHWIPFCRIITLAVDCNLLSGDTNRALCISEEGSAVLSSPMKRWCDAEWLNVSSLQLVCTTVAFWNRGSVLSLDSRLGVCLLSFSSITKRHCYFHSLRQRVAVPVEIYLALHALDHTRRPLSAVWEDDWSNSAFGKVELSTFFARNLKRKRKSFLPLW